MKKTNEIIEDIQEAVVEAGGRFMRQHEIRRMTVEELLNMLTPNDVEFTVKHKREE